MVEWYYVNNEVIFMKKLLIRFLSVLLCAALLLPSAPPAAAYEIGDAYHRDLSAWIKNEKNRSYVEMMLDYYIRSDSMVRNALKGGFAAVFLFDGCSDHMDDPELSDLSYYRVSGVCVVIKLDEAGQPRMLYFSDNCSTIPDRPLEYGAWSLPKVGKVGPATVCDGTYQLYSVYHKGKYEALHVRTEYFDRKIDAVYMTPDGYVPSRASEINVHTRTSNHTSGVGMWSAGCPLVGGGKKWEFWKLMYSTYYTTYEDFEVDNFVGTLTIDRQCLRQELYTLYKNPDAVDMFLTNSRHVQPREYLNACTARKAYEDGKSLRTTGETTLMTLPCSNATDARSLPGAVVPRGQRLEASCRITNTRGAKWYEVDWNGERLYVYSEDASAVDWFARLFDRLFGWLL